MKHFKFIILLFLGFSFTTCTLFKKQISKPIVVAIPTEEFKVILNSSATNTKYTTLTTKEEITSAFLTALESEGKSTQNIIIAAIPQTADYILKINYLSVFESSSTEKVNDPNSSYNGQSYELNSIDCNAEINIIHVRTNTSVGTAFNSKIRSEKLKNNRDLGELITGTNQDHTNYHQKLLFDNICVNLADDVGRRIWTPLTRKLEKAIK